eukprot:CAMPEP_0182867548 /NCGR_PEP_ID=MMETSP0034_2-20130328/8780_1 /TAXON_ID=156128 /ORGANISM="Nephroselmis pyriformis, Strain CCMP717" /LENGTH=64 /DNA_ID=CAMNT_0024999907 /DNA_START=42 /DNA_END=236 /DNA_ORIENTATION=+
MAGDSDWASLAPPLFASHATILWLYLSKSNPGGPLPPRSLSREAMSNRVAIILSSAAPLASSFG